jgi:MoxR-like ATPase
VLSTALKEFEQATSQVLLGREHLARLSMCAMLSGGHILIEDIPGVGKTTFALILAKLSGLKLTRIQCTNDMLPSDILGPTVWHPGRHEFFFRAGPIFSSLVLVDELNRAPSKTQSGLLQAMEEKKITVDGKEIVLPSPFIVMATQNPGDGVGNNPLPDSQIDRFAISFKLDIPSPENEIKMIQQRDIKHLITSLPEIMDARYFDQSKDMLDEIFIHKDLLQYIINLLACARSWPKRAMQLSTRAGRDLVVISKAMALLEGGNIVLPEHIIAAFPYVAGHRLGGVRGVDYGHGLAKQILENVSLP